VIYPELIDGFLVVNFMRAYDTTLVATNIGTIGTQGHQTRRCSSVQGLEFQEDGPIFDFRFLYFFVVNLRKVLIFPYECIYS